MSEAPNIGWMSDIDGTAVKLAEQKYSWQNFRKKDLAPVPGFDLFVTGAELGRAPFYGYVTRRINSTQRRRETQKSLYGECIPLLPAFHTGKRNPFYNHEGAKAQLVVKAALDFDGFGFIDDKPHKIGAELISAIKAVEAHPTDGHVTMVLGAVAQKGTGYLEQLWDVFDANINSADTTFAPHGDYSGHIQIGGSALHVVTISEFSIETGLEFAEDIASYAAAA